MSVDLEKVWRDAVQLALYKDEDVTTETFKEALKFKNKRSARRNRDYMG